MIIYVNKKDYRSFGYVSTLWGGNTEAVEVDDDFVGGDKTYNPETKTWEKDIATQDSSVTEYQQALTALAQQYDQDITTLSNQYAKATLIDGVNETAKKEAIYQEYKDRKATYQADILTLKQQYGI